MNTATLDQYHMDPSSIQDNRALLGGGSRPRDDLDGEGIRDTLTDPPGQQGSSTATTTGGGTGTVQMLDPSLFEDCTDDVVEDVCDDPIEDIPLLTEDQLKAARSFYTKSKHRYPAELIEDMQELLSVTVTMKMDDATIMAIAKFQRDKGETIDGQAGDGTMKKMFGSDVRMRADAKDVETVDKGGLKNVKSGSQITARIKSGWQAVQPKLPASAWLTSGVRSWQKSVDILLDLFEEKKPDLIAKKQLTEEECKALVDQKQYGAIQDWLYSTSGGTTRYFAADPGHSNHCSGKAFDISGGSLDTILTAVEKAATEDETFKKLFKKTIKEDANNCIHVDLK